MRRRIHMRRMDCFLFALVYLTYISLILERQVSTMSHNRLPVSSRLRLRFRTLSGEDELVNIRIILHPSRLLARDLH